MIIFITGTDTDVGKTIIAAWLCHHLQASYWKPVQSGNIVGTDAETIQQICLNKAVIHPSAYSLKAYLSPHEAANLENTNIDIHHLHRLYQNILAEVNPSVTSPLIIEGAGGIFAPLNLHSSSRWCIIDLIKMLQCPALVVARSGLGTINHTCLTIESLHQRQIPILGVIMNGPYNAANKQAIEALTQVPVVAEIPFFHSLAPEHLHNFPLTFELQKCFTPSQNLINNLSGTPTLKSSMPH